MPDEQRKTEIITRSELQAADNWQRSVGKKLYGVHFRERDGTGHAVCPPGSPVCTVHYDAVNAHASPVRHLVKDAPEVIGVAAAAVGAAVLGPKTVRKLKSLIR